MNDMSYIESPIKTGDRYQRLYILSIAATHAIEFDPGLKKYLSNLILKSLYEKLNETASSGIGYVTSKKDYSLSLPFDPKEFNIINFAWSAIELDPSGAKAWAAKYENLVPVFIQHGKSNSAMMTANLAGDLATEATGNADFEKATDAFLRAVLSEKAQKDTIESTAEHYVQLFSDDCKRSLQNGDKRYLGLINAIKSAGASLNHFEQKGLLP
jgi:hypothetical protein